MEKMAVDLNELNELVNQFEQLQRRRVICQFLNHQLVPLRVIELPPQLERLHRYVIVDLENRRMRTFRPAAEQVEVSAPSEAQAETQERVRAAVRSQAQAQGFQVEEVSDEAEFRREVELAIEQMKKLAAEPRDLQTLATVDSSEVRERMYPPLLSRIVGNLLWASEYSDDLVHDIKQTLISVMEMRYEQDKHTIIKRALEKWAKMLDAEAQRSLLDHLRREVLKSDQGERNAKAEIVADATKLQLLAALSQVLEVCVNDDGDVVVSVAKGFGPSSTTVHGHEAGRYT